MVDLAASVHHAFAGTSGRVVTVGALQMSCSPDSDSNIRKAEALIRDAANKGAQIILLQELFATTYFPVEQTDNFRLAVSVDDERCYLSKFRMLAKELGVVLPISFYERANNVYFNTVEVYDADGSSLGCYRKSHIPDSPGYHEKWHFSPGDTGFRVFKSRYGMIGVGICWDQWFPEAARCMALLGAELLLYPTAIGSEPQDPTLDTSVHWQRCMQGHAAANLVPVIAANRIGREVSSMSDNAITFYGSSFIADHTGHIVTDAGRHQEAVLLHAFDLNELASARLSWGVFRDRRPDLYRPLITMTGTTAPLFPNPIQNTIPNHIAAVHQAPPVVMPPASRPIHLPKTMSPQVAVNTGPSLVTAPIPLVSVPVNPNIHTGTFHLPTQVTTLTDDASRKVMNGLEVHEASFIGDVKASAQRRPRGRCWSCRAKTTYECKACDPGPVPLCNRTARDCWWKYHAGEVTPFVPNKRGRKRRKDGSVDDDDDDDEDIRHITDRKSADVVAQVDADVPAGAAASVVGNVHVSVPMI